VASKNVFYDFGGNFLSSNLSFGCPPLSHKEHYIQKILVETYHFPWLGILQAYDPKKILQNFCCFLTKNWEIFGNLNFFGVNLTKFVNFLIFGDICNTTFFY